MNRGTERLARISTHARRAPSANRRPAKMLPLTHQCVTKSLPSIVLPSTAVAALLDTQAFPSTTRFTAWALTLIELPPTKGYTLENYRDPANAAL